MENRENYLIRYLLEALIEIALNEKLTTQGLSKVNDAISKASDFNKSNNQD